jgi:hypothetical protein
MTGRAHKHTAERSGNDIFVRSKQNGGISGNLTGGDGSIVGITGFILAYAKSK